MATQTTPIVSAQDPVKPATGAPVSPPKVKQEHEKKPAAMGPGKAEPGRK